MANKLGTQIVDSEGYHLLLTGSSGITRSGRIHIYNAGSNTTGVTVFVKDNSNSGFGERVYDKISLASEKAVGFGGIHLEVGDTIRINVAGTDPELNIFASYND